MTDIIAYDYKAAEEKYGETITENERRYEVDGHAYILRDRLFKINEPIETTRWWTNEYATKAKNGDRIWHRCEGAVNFSKIEPFETVGEGK